MPEWLVVEQYPRRYRVRRASPGEVVRTPTSSVLAEDGQWVLEGDDGDCWVLDGAELHKYYRVVQPTTA